MSSPKGRGCQESDQTNNDLLNTMTYLYLSEGNMIKDEEILKKLFYSR